MVVLEGNGKEVKWKNYILNSAAANVKYNDTHKRKKIRNLNESYLSYIDRYDGFKKVNLTNVVSMFESTCLNLTCFKFKIIFVII